MHVFLEVISAYNRKIKSIEGMVNSILMKEEEEKAIDLSEMEMRKAINIVKHEQEISSRPARTWMKRKAAGKRKKRQHFY